MKITCVADEKTCTWMKMSGIGKVYPVSDPKEAGPILKELVETLDIGIILITPEIAKAQSRIVHQNLAKKDVFPIILELPVGEDISTGLQDLISAALGIEFKL